MSMVVVGCYPDFLFQEYGTSNIMSMVVVVDVKALKMARKPVKLQKESPAGCAGEGKQNKGK